MKYLIGPLLALMFALCFFAGWVTNVIWTFKQNNLTDVLLGILGCILAPIGALHGIYTWF